MLTSVFYYESFPFLNTTPSWRRRGFTWSSFTSRGREGAGKTNKQVVYYFALLKIGTDHFSFRNEVFIRKTMPLLRQDLSPGDREMQSQVYTK